MPQPTIAVAVSGGRDSTALLHQTCTLARREGWRVLALHVHHGLMAEADRWVEHLRRQCARWRRGGAPLEFRWRRLDGCPAPGESVEAWARAGRYAALAAMARAEGAEVVLLAHHAQDQAETVLLQALRSGSPRGLAAMPRETLRDGLRWCRPWLEQDPSAIATYVRRHRLTHVDDASNADPRFARSRLRAQVWPALTGAFPDAAAALGAVARRAQETQACLTALAALDLAPIQDAEGGLRLEGWLALGPSRGANALRHWWQGVTGASAPASLVERLIAEAPHARSGARWVAPGGELRLYRGRLHWHAGHGSGAADRSPAPDEEQVMDLSTLGEHALPRWRGRLQVVPVPADGVPSTWLTSAVLRPRTGGERFQAQAAGVPRSLKKGWQSAGVPAAGRAGPLVYGGDGRLLWVPGLGLDARHRQPAGRGLVELRWSPDSD